MFLTTFVMALFFTQIFGCRLPREKIRIQYADSWFDNFEIHKDKVLIKCSIALYNPHSSSMKFTISAEEPEDVKTGLLKNARLDTIYPENADFFEIGAKQTRRYDITFQGEYGGVELRENRLLPSKLTIFEIFELTKDGKGSKKSISFVEKDGSFSSSLALGFAKKVIKPDSMFDDKESVGKWRALKDVSSTDTRVSFWNGKRIQASPFWWNSPLVENEQYYFYVSGREIRRIDKRTDSEVVLKRMSQASGQNELSLSLADSVLYVICDSALYSIDFSGDSFREIISRKDFTSMLDFPENADFWGVKEIDGKLYILSSGLEVSRYDSSTRTVENIASDARAEGFLRDAFYYIQRGANSLYRVNLTTRQKEVVRGQGIKTEVLGTRSEVEGRYSDLTVFQSELYYLFNSTQIFRYNDDGADEMVLELPANYFVSGFVSGDDGLYFTCLEGEDDFQKEYLGKYDIKTKAFSKMLLPDDFITAGSVVDNCFFYSARNPLKPDEELSFYKCTVAHDK
jgi:hypothetical protein